MDRALGLPAVELVSGGRMFLVGQFANRITLRSQQLRALNLVHALEHLLDGASIAVIGGGVAGVTVAAALAEWTRADKVDVYERASALLPLQRHCKTRYLHPYVIEWPYADEASRAGDDATLPLMNWHAAYADQVCLQLIPQFEAIRSRNPGRLYVYLEHRIDDVGGEVADGVLVKGNCSRGNFSRRYDFLVVATGFGAEQQSSHPTPFYWENDSVDQLVRDFQGETGQRRRVLVSGVGDGGLIDALRSVLATFRHDSLLESVLHQVDAATRSHLRRLDAELHTLDMRDEGAVEHYIAEFCNVDVPAIDDHLRRQIRRDTKLWLAGRVPHPCLAGNANIMHRLLVTRLMEIERHAKDPALVYCPNGLSVEWADGRGEATIDGKLVQFDAVLVRHGTHTLNQSIIQALSRMPGADLARVARDARALPPPGEAFRARLTYRQLSLLPAIVAVTRREADAQTGLAELGDLVDLWLSSAPTHLLIDVLRRAEKRVAVAASPQPIQTALRVRLQIMLAEQQTKLRRPVPASAALESARVLLRDLPYSPQMVQAELDLEWLESIVLKLNQRNAQAIALCAEAIQGLPARAIRHSGDAGLLAQLKLHEARMRRSLLTYLAETGDWLAARRACEDAEALTRAGSFDLKDAVWLAECHMLPVSAMQRLILHESFQLLRRQTDFWLQAGDTHLALAQFRALSQQYLEALEQNAIDNITKLNFFRIVAGLCARAAIGADAKLRGRLLVLARRCFGVSRLAAAGQDLPMATRMRDALLLTLDRNAAIDDLEAAASHGEQQALVHQADQELQRQAGDRGAPVTLTWPGDAPPGLARVSHAGIFGLACKAGVAFAKNQAVAQRMLTRLVDVDLAGVDDEAALALVRQAADELSAGYSADDGDVAVLLVIRDEPARRARWYKCGALDLSLNGSPVEAGSCLGAFSTGGTLGVRLRRSGRLACGSPEDWQVWDGG